MGALWDMAVFEYKSDDGNTYYVGLSVSVGLTAGFNLAPAGALPNYPRGWKMRRVYGKENGGYSHSSMPVPDASYAAFSGAPYSWTTHGVTYNAQGRVGEKRTSRI